MTFDEFLIETHQSWKYNDKGVRFGQFLFASICKANPNLAAEILATEYDPYYCTNKIPTEVIDKLSELWSVYE